MPPQATRIRDVIKHVDNFRAITDATQGLDKGRVFRCACPVKAAEKDMVLLRNNLGITTMIDLRSEEEMMKYGQAPILSGATLSVHTRLNTKSVWLGRTPEMQQLKTTLPGIPEHEPFEVNHISILDRRRFIAALVPRLPVSSIAQAAYKRVTKGTQASYDIMLEQINEGGLTLLYEIILDTSRPEIGVALHVVKDKLEHEEAVLIFCKAGKDRTGLLSMLILSTTGATDEEIIADYHRSDGHGKMALGDLEKNQELVKLDKTVFQGAPEIAMQDALAYIRKMYGSVSDYMIACGFSKEDQDALGDLLIA